MFSLIKFEFKKLAKKRTNIITVLVSIILTIIFFSLPAMRFEYTDTKGEKYKGLKAIELKKEDIKDISVQVTEEQVEKDIKEYQRLFSIPENITKDDSGRPHLKNDIYDDYVNPRHDYFVMIAGIYDNSDEHYYLSSLLKINLQNGANFYEARTNEISTLLDRNHEGGNYSEQEKTFWINKNDKIQKPYTYGYHEGWSAILSIFGSLIFPLLAICITVAPVFAGEYQCGADAVILSSKYGKTKVITAKIVSAFTFATIVFSLNVFFALAMPLLSFGIDGWNLPMQIERILIPYSVTFASGTFISIGITYIIMIGIVSFTLLLSAKFKTPFTVLIIDVVILFISSFMSEGAYNGVFNHILYLLPYKSLDPRFSSYLSYSFGGLTVSLMLMRIIVYGVMAIVFLPFAKNAFRKHQVQ